MATSLAGIQSSGELGPLRMFLEEVKVAKFVNWSPGSTCAVWQSDRSRLTSRPRSAGGFGSLPQWTRGDPDLFTPAGATFGCRIVPE